MKRLLLEADPSNGWSNPLFSRVEMLLLNRKVKAMNGKRVVVKIGSSSLTDHHGCISDKKIHELVIQISDLINHHDLQVILVSSGAVATGLGRLGWSRSQITIPEKQAAAAVGQGLLIECYRKLFEENGIEIAQLLLTRSDVEHRHRFIHIRNTIEALLRNHILPIINENDTVAVDEIRFGDNDTLGSLVALVSEADLLILLTDIDGLYTANPKKTPTAKRIPEVWKITSEMTRSADEEGSIVGTGGMRTKLAAAQIATKTGIDVVIASSTEPHVLKRICLGEKIGTRFYSSTRLSSKKSWIAFGTRHEGELVIDQGAVEALLHRSGSLLLAGILRVKGEFHAGEVVIIQSPSGDQIAKGITNFSKNDLQLLLRKKEQGERLQKIHEVVHRDYMVVF